MKELKDISCGAADSVPSSLPEVLEQSSEPAVPRTTVHDAPRRRRTSYIFWTATALLLAGTAGIVWQRSRTQAGLSSIQTERALPPSDLVIPNSEQMRQISVDSVAQRAVTVDRDATGHVAFNEDRLTPVFTPFAGRVVELLVNKGATVRKDQPLLVLDSPELISAQNDLAAARSDLAKAKIGQDAAQITVDRARRLHQSEALATKDLQQAETDLARAQDEYRRADSVLTAVESRLALFGKAPEEIAQLASRVDRKVVIRAPLAGTIVDRKVGPGQYVRPDSSDSLFLISDLSTLWVQADVFEADLAGIEANASVEISVTAYPDRIFPAKISFISPTVDPATRTVRVRCLVGNAGGLLKPDMFARIKIRGAAQRAIAVIPSRAVVSHGTESLVFVEEAPGRFRRRKILAGQEIEGSLRVVSGLKPHELVVTNGALLLNELIGSQE